MIMYGGLDVQLHAFLNSALGRSQESDSLRKEFLIPMGQRLGGPQSQSGNDGEKSAAPTGI
jgi:hypothetical protein